MNKFRAWIISCLVGTVLIATACTASAGGDRPSGVIYQPLDNGEIVTCIAIVKQPSGAAIDCNWDEYNNRMFNKPTKNEFEGHN